VVLNEKLDALPVRSGVYLFKDALGQILYVGKARVLRDRVRSYFQASRTWDPHKGAMVAEIAPGAKSTCGLSNISNGPPGHLRPILNQTYMVMLQKHGMYSVIADPLDTQLAAIAKGKRQDIVDLIYGVMDGNQPNMISLSKEMQDYAKTVNVILGNTLYSDSWLEI